MRFGMDRYSHPTLFGIIHLVYIMFCTASIMHDRSAYKIPPPPPHHTTHPAPPHPPHHPIPTHPHTHTHTSHFSGDVATYPCSDLNYKPGPFSLYFRWVSWKIYNVSMGSVMYDRFAYKKVTYTYIFINVCIYILQRQRWFACIISVFVYKASQFTNNFLYLLFCCWNIGLSGTLYLTGTILNTGLHSPKQLNEIWNSS